MLDGRIMGLDIGDKTIGVAVSDIMGITAQGVKTIRRESKKKDIEELKNIIKERYKSEAHSTLYSQPCNQLTTHHNAPLIKTTISNFEVLIMLFQSFNLINI